MQITLKMLDKATLPPPQKKAQNQANIEFLEILHTTLECFPLFKIILHT